jgi:hypothetical protein
MFTWPALMPLTSTGFLWIGAFAGLDGALLERVARTTEKWACCGLRDGEGALRRTGGCGVCERDILVGCSRGRYHSS